MLTIHLPRLRAVDKPFKGYFNIRIGEKLHEKATLVALDHNMKLNEFVKTAIDHKIERLHHKKNQVNFLKSQLKLISAKNMKIN